MRTLAALTWAAAPSSSEETVDVPDRSSSTRIRWYTGRRATVASGILRPVAPRTAGRDSLLGGGGLLGTAGS